MSLNLSGNNINDVGAQALAEMLKINTTLESLELNCNGIEYDGAVALAESLVENTSLKVLALRWEALLEAIVALLENLFPLCDIM